MQWDGFDESSSVLLMPVEGYQSGHYVIFGKDAGFDELHCLHSMARTALG
jgi:hypothetical protein